MHFTPGWCVGWYFVPIWNLFRPHQCMREIWDTVHLQRPVGSALLRLWWLFWILYNIAGRAAWRFEARATELAGYVLCDTLYTVSDGIDVILHVLALMLVTRVAAAYAENIREEGPRELDTSQVPEGFFYGS